MLHQYVSSRLDRLVDAAAEVLRTPVGTPFDADWCVLGARATERWATARIAERLGVCAHVRFLSPSTLLEDVVHATLGAGRPDVRGWRAERLTWHVLAALPDLIDGPAFAPVREYLRHAEASEEASGIGRGDARALSFAERVGGCFARYAVAWPELATAWDAGEGDDWQPRLWRALRARGARHVAELAREAEEVLQRGGRSSAIAPRIVWLAEPPVAPVHARLVAALAASGTDVHVLVPTPDMSGSARAAHPLLRSLGRMARDTGTLLGEACEAAGVAVRTIVVGDGEAMATSLLGRLQRDVVENVARGPDGAPPLPVGASDGSIQIHACHGAMRQAEVLRDALLGLFDARPDLQPRDVLVLTPDVPTFAPLVEAAFHGSPGLPSIPVRVVDHPVRRSNVVADVALRVMALAATRVDAVDVLDLLALPAVAARFGLAAGAEDTLRRWIRESAVRWGIDPADRSETHGLPADDEHTWRFGLDRLLLGWGMPGDGRRTFGGALPYDEIEGGDADLLGRLAEACTRVFAGVHAVRDRQTIPEWRATLSRIVDTLVGDDDALTVSRRAFDHALDALAEDAAPFPGPVEPAAVRRLVEARFAEPAGAGGAAGAVTLAALRAGRVLPARVVVLIGVDDACFPRRRASIGFDLLASARRPGSPDPGEEDRLRVLEALLAARDHLLVLYTGRTVDTNQAVAPAVPIGELLDAFDATFAHAGASDERPARTLVETVHPLQAFSPRAFDGVSTPRSHDTRHLAGARAARGPRTDPPPFLGAGRIDDATREAHPTDDAVEVTVEELARFLAHPARELVAWRLGAWLDEPLALEVQDPMELDSLAEHRVRGTLVAQLLDGTHDRDAALRLLRAGGHLPHASLGEAAFLVARCEALAVARPARALRTGDRTPRVTIDRTIGRWQLTGYVGPLWNGGLVEVQAGTVRAKHLTALWVRHLALHAVAPGIAATSYLVGKPDAKGTNVHALAPVDDGDAERLLAALLDLRDVARHARVPLLPASCDAYAAAYGGAVDAFDGHRAGIAAARDQYAPVADRVRGERDDPYVQRLHGASDPLGEPAFAELALRVWGPLRAHLSTTAR